MVKIHWTRTMNCCNGNNSNKNYFFIKFTLIMFKLIGLAPLTISKRQTLENVGRNNISRVKCLVRFGYSRIHLIYNIFLVICVFVISIGSVKYLFDRVYLAKTKLTIMLDIVEVVAGVMIVIVIFLLSCTKQNSMMKLLNGLIRFDEEFSYVRVSQKSESCRFYMITCFLTNIVIWIYMIMKEFEITIFTVVNSMLPGVILGWFTLQYTMMVKLIGIRLCNLNKALIDISVSPIYSCASFNYEVSVSRDYHDFPKIIAIRRAYNILCAICYDISKFYSLPIFLVIAWVSWTIVCIGHIFITQLTNADQTDVVNNSLYSVSRVLCLTLPIVLLTTNVDRINYEMTETSQAVYKVLSRPDTSGQLKSKLKQFSIEMFQRKIEFTACGLLRLDCTILGSIFSMAATYLIITYQFHMSES